MKLLMTTDGVGGVWTYAMELARGLAILREAIGVAVKSAPIDMVRKERLA